MLIKKMAVAAAGIFAVSACLNLALEHCRAWINISDSLPLGVYQTEQDLNNLEAGDLVLSCVPDLYAEFAFDRGYIFSGSCKAKTAPVGKYIAAIPGDHVIINSEGVFVNGRMLENSRPLLADAQGKLLPAESMDRKLSAGEYILVNRKANSFDSRYFGVVKKELLLAKLKALYTLAERDS